MKKINFSILVFILFNTSIFSQTDSTLKNHSNVISMAFTPDGQKMVTGCENGSIQVWNGKGQMTLNIQASDKPITQIAISPRGQRICFKMDYSNTIIIDNLGNILDTIPHGGNFYFDYYEPNFYILNNPEISKYDENGKLLNKINLYSVVEKSGVEVEGVWASGFAVKPDGGVTILCSHKLHPSKEKYEFWMKELDKELNVTRVTKIPFDPSIHSANMATNARCQKVIISGWCSLPKKLLYEGFHYVPTTGAISTGKGYASTSGYYMTLEDDKIVTEGYHSIGLEGNSFDIPLGDYNDKYFISNDLIHVVVANKNQPLSMYDFREKKKIFDFDCSTLVADTYAYTPPGKPVVESPMKAMAIFAPASSASTPDLAFDLNNFTIPSDKPIDIYLNEIAFELQSVSSGEYYVWKNLGEPVADFDGSSLGLYNTAFVADLSFHLPRGSTNLKAFVEFTFWKRKEPNTTKEQWEEYSVKVSSLGEVTIGRTRNGIFETWVTKNLMGINISDKVFNRMILSASANGAVDCEFFTDKPGDESKHLSTSIYTSEAGPFLISVKSFDADCSKLKISGNNIAKKTMNTTFLTNLKGCIAGDCFNGFGYYITNQWSDYTGYFVNGIKQGIGQEQIANNAIIYNGNYSENNPNGYGATNFYTSQIIEIGTYAKYKKMGEFTTHFPSRMVTATMNDETKISDGRKTGCLEGNCIDGMGIYQFENGTRYAGNFEAAKLVSGTVVQKNGNVIIFDTLTDGGKSGNIDLLTANGLVIHGTFSKGKMQGHILLKFPISSHLLAIEGLFTNGIGTQINILFRDGRKWVGTQLNENSPWATGTGTMTYPDGKMKKGQFDSGEWISE